jgi:hypothetical protein
MKTVLVERLFAVARMHTGADQTMKTALKTMEHDQSTKCPHDNQHIFKRQTYGHIVDPTNEKIDLDERMCITLARAYLKVVKFPLSESRLIH